jgi:hypothetical protein
MAIDARTFWFVIGTSWGGLFILLGTFMYFWAADMSPLSTLAQVACNVPAVSNVLFQACSRISMNMAILSYVPDVAVVLIILGCILLTVGLHISTGKEKSGKSWRTRDNKYY